MCVCVCACYTRTSWPGRVKLWADTFGRDLYDTVTKYSGSLLLQKVSDSLPGGGRAVSQGVLRERRWRCRVLKGQLGGVSEITASSVLRPVAWPRSQRQLRSPRRRCPDGTRGGRAVKSRWHAGPTPVTGQERRGQAVRLSRPRAAASAAGAGRVSMPPAPEPQPCPGTAEPTGPPRRSEPRLFLGRTRAGRQDDAPVPPTAY